jgi:hypothetical protein
MLLLLVGCVKKSEYDALQIENQTLQTRVDQTNHLLVQSQADLSALQVQMQQFLVVQAQLLKTQQDLKQSRDEFRTQRRSAMVGKKFPVLNLDDGKVLHQAEITAVSADEVAIRHADGILKVALAKTSPDLRWEACYDPLEATEKARENLLLKAREEAARLVREQAKPAPAPVAAVPARNVVEVLRTQLASQRQILNADYQVLAAKNPSAMRGAQWNSSQPETSPFLTTITGSRAVLGISRLQSQRTAILATLQQLRELDPAAR